MELDTPKKRGRPAKSKQWPKASRTSSRRRSLEGTFCYCQAKHGPTNSDAHDTWVTCSKCANCIHYYIEGMKVRKRRQPFSLKSYKTCRFTIARLIFFGPLVLYVCFIIGIFAFEDSSIALPNGRINGTRQTRQNQAKKGGYFQGLERMAALLTNPTKLECVDHSLTPKTYWMSRRDGSINPQAEPALQHLGWTWTTIDNATLIWARGSKHPNKESKNFVKSKKCLSERFYSYSPPGLNALYDKTKLPQTLKHYSESTGTRIDFLPNTFSMNVELDVRKFFEEASCGGNVRVWLIKNAKKSRARGLTLSDDVVEIRELFVVGEDVCEQGLPDGVVKRIQRTNRNVIIQEYIDKPLLFDGRKFQIRVFSLVAHLNPLLAFYCDAFVQTAAVEYNMDSLDPAAHITNVALSKTIPTDGIITAASLDMLQETVTKSNKTLEGCVVDTLLPQIKEMLITSYKAAAPIIHKAAAKSAGKYFTVIASDLIVTENLKVILCEFQRGPRHTYSKHEGWGVAIAKKIVYETLGIVMEVDERARAGRDLKNLTSVKEFQVLVDYS